MTEPAAPPPRRPTSRPLDEDECRTIVARNFWGTLGTVEGDRPYVVPIIYGFDGAFYAVLRPGRKLSNLDANPNATLTIVEVEGHAKQWRSVLAEGTVDFLDDDDAMAAAIDVIRAQYPAEPTRSGQGMAALRAAGFRVMRLRVKGLSGRTQE